MIILFLSIFFTQCNGLSCLNACFHYNYFSVHYHTFFSLNLFDHHNYYYHHHEPSMNTHHIKQAYFVHIHNNTKTLIVK